MDAGASEKELERVMKKSGFDEAPPPPKRKPLRTKLSLKKLKADADATLPEGDAVPSFEKKSKTGSTAKKSKNRNQSYEC